MIFEILGFFLDIISWFLNGQNEWQKCHISDFVTLNVILPCQKVHVYEGTLLKCCLPMLNVPN